MRGCFRSVEGRSCRRRSNDYSDETTNDSRATEMKVKAREIQGGEEKKSQEDNRDHSRFCWSRSGRLIRFLSIVHHSPRCWTCLFPLNFLAFEEVRRLVTWRLIDFVDQISREKGRERGSDDGHCYSMTSHVNIVDFLLHELSSLLFCPKWQTQS